MKKIIAAATALVLILSALCGCMNRNVDFSEPEGVQTSNSIWLAYDCLNDAKEYEIKLDGPTSICAEITTDGGSLWIKLVDTAGSTVFEKTVSEKADFTIDVAEAGKYRVILKGNDHIGGFLFTW